MIRIGVIGCGNLGRGVERVISLNEDMELVGIFTRRNPAEVSTLYSHVYSMDKLMDFKDKIDVCILCGGSARDLPEQTPLITEHFNTVDSFDNHAKIPEHFQRVDEVAKASGKVSVISVGWDPGLFSINRLMGEAILPQGRTHTFWGKGVSQGHSDAIRRVDGVKLGVQYTIPKEEVIDRILAGEDVDLSTADKHIRLCYVVAEEGADEESIREAIVTMPNYFADYETRVEFITEEDFKKDHTGMPHGGRVIRLGETSPGTKQAYEFRLSLDSNPDFTASVSLAYARACYRLAKEGRTGAFTVLDIAPKYLSPKSDLDLQRDLL